LLDDKITGCEPGKLIIHKREKVIQVGCSSEATSSFLSFSRLLLQLRSFCRYPSFHFVVFFAVRLSHLPSILEGTATCNLHSWRRRSAKQRQIANLRISSSLIACLKEVFDC